MLLCCNILTPCSHLFASNFYAVPVVAPDLQLVTKEVPKDHVQVMLEKRKARHSKNRVEDTEVRSLNSEFGNMDLKSISAASLSPCNPRLGTPLSSIGPSASNRFRELMNAKFKKFVKANPMLKGHNLVFVDGDDNCAPRTIAVLMYGSQGLWSQAKAIVANFALKNFQELVTIIGLCDNELIKMATDRSWQSEVFFKVAAIRFEVDIAVFGYGGEDKLYQALNGAKNELKVFFWNGHFCPIVKSSSMNRYGIMNICIYMLHYNNIFLTTTPFLAGLVSPLSSTLTARSFLRMYVLQNPSAPRRPTTPPDVSLLRSNQSISTPRSPNAPSTNMHLPPLPRLKVQMSRRAQMSARVLMSWRVLM